jgi:dihydroorotate dehydrogenase
VALEDAVDDYLKSFEAVFPVADYVAINISSPNTPRLRELQDADQLERLLTSLNSKCHELGEKLGRRDPLPLLLKLAPDLEAHQLETIVDVARRHAIAGLIATNTTVTRQGLKSSTELIEAIGSGGLSGTPLRQRSTEVIATLYKLTQGSIPIIGVGGIFNASDAWEKICAGASLIQLYTGFIYEGPAIVRRINDGLSTILKKEGFNSLSEAVGCRTAKLVNRGDSE